VSSSYVRLRSRYNPGYAGFGSGADEGRLSVVACVTSYGDDEHVLTLEGGDKSRGIGIIDGTELDPRNGLVGRVEAGDGGDVEDALLEEGINDESTDLAGSLRKLVCDTRAAR
jgi:hypothetical protein